MNRLIVQEIENFLSRSVVYLQKESLDTVELVAKDLVTGKQITFTKENIYNVNGKLTTTTYRISEDHKSSKRYFRGLYYTQEQQVFDKVYNRYKKYFEQEHNTAQTKFYQSLLKNNHRVK